MGETGAAFENERIHYMSADHRSICKFQSPEDSNYVSPKNALATIVSEFLHESKLELRKGLLCLHYFFQLTVPGAFMSKKDVQDQLHSIRELLQPASLPEEYRDKLEGSCQWIKEREDFAHWMDPLVSIEKEMTFSPSIYWTNGDPGAGKTVLATHVAALLSESQVPS